MKLLSKILYTNALLLVLISCQQDEKLRIIEQQKASQKREQVYQVVNQNWNFNGQASTVTSQNLTQNWTEWRNFLKEINQKPKSTIGAFQKKAKTLSLKAADLNNNIPETYNKPEIKSRISAIIVKVNTLNLFINRENIPKSKIVQLIPELQQELNAIQQQFYEIDQKNQIKLEDGEADMIRMLDTTRAIPTQIPNSKSTVNSTLKPNAERSIPTTK